MYPQSDQIAKALAKLGFDFELEYPRAKHPKLLVFHEGQFLAPGTRFPVMREKLREELKIEEIGPLKDICFLQAHKKEKS